MSTNAPIRWFRGIREVQPSAFHDPAAVDFPPGTVVGIKTRAPVGQLDLFTDPVWQQRNRVVECDRDGRVIHKPLAESTAPPDAVTPAMATVTDFELGTRFFRPDNEPSATMFANPLVDNFVRRITHEPGDSIVGFWDTGSGRSGFCNPRFRSQNYIVECDQLGRSVEVAPVLPVGDPAQVNLAEPLSATAAPLVTFEVAPTPKIPERDAAIVAKLRERGIPLASIAAAVNEATPEQIVECLLDQQAKRLAAEHAAAMESTVRECGAILAIRSDAIQPIRALQEMLADCAVMSQNTEHAVRIRCGYSVVPSELHSAINRFINAKLTGDGSPADAVAPAEHECPNGCAAIVQVLDSSRIEDCDHNGESCVRIISDTLTGPQISGALLRFYNGADRPGIKREYERELLAQLEETRQEAADQKQAHTKEINELRAAARCGANDTLLDRVRKLAENCSPSDLRVCREQLQTAERVAKDYRESFERENRLLVEANRQLATLRGCIARVAKAFDSLTLLKAGYLSVSFGDISAIVQLIDLGVVPGSMGPLDLNTEGAK